MSTDRRHPGANQAKNLELPSLAISAKHRIGRATDRFRPIIVVLIIDPIGRACSAGVKPFRSSQIPFAGQIFQSSIGAPTNRLHFYLCNRLQ
jgi:hypothetical protein